MTLKNTTTLHTSLLHLLAEITHKMPFKSKRKVSQVSVLPQETMETQPLKKIQLLPSEQNTVKHFTEPTDKFQFQKLDALEQNKVFDRILEGKKIIRPFYFRINCPLSWAKFSRNMGGVHIIDIYFIDKNMIPFQTPKKIRSVLKEQNQIPESWKFNPFYILENQNINMCRFDWIPVCVKKSYSCYNANLISENPACIHFLEQNPEYIHWTNLAMNQSVKAIDLITKNIDTFWNTFAQTTDSENEQDDEDEQTTLIDRKWQNLSRNPFAVDSFLRGNIDHIDWNNLLECNHSENAIQLVEENIDYLLENVIEESYLFELLSKNTGAVSFLAKNQDKIHWPSLCKNTKAAQLILQNQDKIDYVELALNSNPLVIPFLALHADKLRTSFQQSFDSHSDFSESDESNESEETQFWRNLCFNKNATHILEKNIHIVRKHVSYENLNNFMCSDDMIFLHRIKRNDAFLNPFIVETFFHGIWNWASHIDNPHIIHILFPLDTKKMQENIAPLRQELISHVWNPDRISRISSLLNMSFQEYLQCLGQ